jgi:Asp-tRNA(Asn)/Glu-tRNA(Gln) amidotransferase C subunit
LKFHKRGEIAFRTSDDKIVEWVDKLEELELNLSKEEVYSPVSFSHISREDETKPSFTTEPAYLIRGERRFRCAVLL